MTKQQSRKAQRTARLVIKHILLVTLAAGMLYPIIWMFLSSFKANDEIFDVTAVFPRKWLFENYADGWFAMAGHPFGEFFKNSFLISGFIVVGTMISAALTAYPFARIAFRGKKYCFPS